MGSALAFLELKGVDVAASDGASLYDATIALADKHLDKAGLAAVSRSSPTP